VSSMNPLLKIAVPPTDLAMTTALRVLHLEANPQDGDRIEALLVEGGLSCAMRRVETHRAFTSALNDGQVDLILAAFSLHGFDEGGALAVAQQAAPDVPFIFISAADAETRCIEHMHRGATDCISKEGLGRLVPSVRRVLREREARVARKQAEDARIGAILRYKSSPGVQPGCGLRLVLHRFRHFCDAGIFGKLHSMGAGIYEPLR